MTSPRAARRPRSRSGSSSTPSPSPTRSASARAAVACGVSQPSLSAQLAELEGALGARLFERDRRRVLLTPAGEALVARARRVLTDADDLADAGKRLGDPLAGTVRLGVIPTISSYLLPDLARALKREHARLTVRWTEDKTETLVGALEDGTLDAAVLALEADLGDLAREPIARDPSGSRRRAATRSRGAPRP